MKNILKKQKPSLKVNSLDELLDKQYGRRGTPKREVFEKACEKELKRETLKQAKRKLK